MCVIIDDIVTHVACRMRIDLRYLISASSCCFHNTQKKTTCAQVQADTGASSREPAGALGCGLVSDGCVCVEEADSENLSYNQRASFARNLQSRKAAFVIGVESFGAAVVDNIFFQYLR